MLGLFGDVWRLLVSTFYSYFYSHASGSKEVCLFQSVDLLLVVDGSGSIGSGNFTLVKKFMATLVSDIPVKGRRVAVVQFSTPRTEFDFNTHPDGASNEVLSSKL